MTYAALWIRRRRGLRARDIVHYHVALYRRAEEFGGMVTGITGLMHACSVMPFEIKDIYRCCLEIDVNNNEQLLPTCVTCQRIREALKSHVTRIDFSTAI